MFLARRSDRMAAAVNTILILACIYNFELQLVYEKVYSQITLFSRLKLLAKTTKIII